MYPSKLQQRLSSNRTLGPILVRRNKAIAPYLCRVALVIHIAGCDKSARVTRAVTTCSLPDHDDATARDSLDRYRDDTPANPPTREQGAATD
jgi:hypothetical protein